MIKRTKQSKVKRSNAAKRRAYTQMKREDILLNDKARAELVALKNRPVDLSDPDAPEITDWSNAVVGKFYRPIKKQITLRLDADMLEWFKAQGGKYQARINKALREYMESKDS